MTLPGMQAEMTGAFFDLDGTLWRGVPAEADELVQAVHDNDPDPKLLAYQYLQTLPLACTPRWKFLARSAWCYGGKQKLSPRTPRSAGG